MTDHFRDPVCGMDVTPQSAAAKTEYNGKTYYFCCLRCKDSFHRDPQRYLTQAVATASDHCC